MIGNTIISLMYKTRMYFQTFSFPDIKEKTDISIQDVMINVISTPWHSYCLAAKFYDNKNKVLQKIPLVLGDSSK